MWPSEIDHGLEQPRQRSTEWGRHGSLTRLSAGFLGTLLCRIPPSSASGRVNIFRHKAGRTESWADAERTFGSSYGERSHCRADYAVCLGIWKIEL